MQIERPQSKQPLPDNAKLVFKGILFDVYQWEVDGYDGKKRIFEKLKRADSALVIPVTEDGKIIMSRQEQPGKKAFLGLVGGRVDEGEDALEAGKRELLEETGYQSAEWELFDAVQPTSKIEWAVFTFIARRCKKVADQSLDGAEKFDLMEVTFDKFLDIVSQSDYADTELKLKVLEARLDANRLAQLKVKILGN